MRSDLPGSDVLARAVQDALDEVALLNEASPTVSWTPIGGWTNAICEAISKRVRVMKAGIECAFGRDREKRADEREWLFDYCALFFEEKSREVRRFVAQALIIGEVEFSDINGLDTDFEKLLIVDSLVCFFAFPGWLKDNVDKTLDDLEKIAKRRQQYAIDRGINRPPIFVLSCYFFPEKQFIHRVVDMVPAV